LAGCVQSAAPTGPWGTVKLGVRKAVAKLRSSLLPAKAAPRAYRRKALRVVRRTQAAARAVGRRLGIKRAAGDESSVGSRSVGLPSSNLVRPCPEQKPGPGSVSGASPP